MGLHRAGFDVVGVDIAPQPCYPFPFIQGDALNPPVRLEDFDLVWASPPCQGYTSMTNRRLRRGTTPRLIGEVRVMLKSSGVAWVIENVPGSIRDMQSPVRLEGGMFGIGVHRPRLFETSGFMVMAPPRRRRAAEHVRVYGPPDGRRLWNHSDGSISYAWRLEEGREAMGMPWADADGVRQAIPPAYSEWIGRYAMLALEVSDA